MQGLIALKCKIKKLNFKSKKMKNLKLNKLEERNLSEKQMNNIKGGEPHKCGCGCCYANSGGSSVCANGKANAQGGIWTSACEIKQIYFENNGNYYDLVGNKV
ncbi:hypothetical protein FACS1894178_1080 [Bacteroidia bacterium]|nr:hypothetical protein FACS1894178_1080 [Bacteroidia bacterium]